VTITNTGYETATLVQPGDGSTTGWRTPIVSWSVLEMTDKAEHPLEAVPESGGGCGNINRLTPDQVLDIAPGETKEVRAEWASWPSQPFGVPGKKYRMVVLYTNRPNLTWQGTPLGVHDPGAMKRVKQSTACSLVSNELVFTIAQ
jgi:hypothetical protein